MAAAKKGDAPPAKEFVLTAESQALDLTSPAGKYCLDLAHPGSALIVKHLLALKGQLEKAMADGQVRLWKNSTVH